MGQRRFSLSSTLPSVILQNITGLLRAGFHPRDFGGEIIGDGCQRIAWLLSDYVIKRRAAAYRLDSECEIPYSPIVVVHRSERFQMPLATFARLGILPPVQWFAKAPSLTWVVQPYYRPLTNEEVEAWEWINNRTIYWDTPLSHHRIRLDMHTGNMGVDPLGAVHAIDW
jgi:hypothetical protein